MSDAPMPTSRITQDTRHRTTISAAPQTRGTTALWRRPRFTSRVESGSITTGVAAITLIIQCLRVTAVVHIVDSARPAHGGCVGSADRTAREGFRATAGEVGSRGTI